jgi:hypothetical protein
VVLLVKEKTRGKQGRNPVSLPLAGTTLRERFSIILLAHSPAFKQSTRGVKTMAQRRKRTPNGKPWFRKFDGRWYATISLTIKTPIVPITMG